MKSSTVKHLYLVVTYGSLGKNHLVAEWLVLPISDQKIPSLNPARGGIKLMTVWYFIAQPVIIILPLSQYDFNNVEKDIKHQTVRQKLLK